MLRLRSKTEDAGPDTEGLEEFVREGDRARPLHFAGRKAEIEDTQALIQSARKEGQTRVMTAAPGAGKTALLRELARRFSETNSARVVELDPEVFKEPARAIKLFLKQLDAAAASRLDAVTTETETGGMEVSAGLPGVAKLSGSGQSLRSVQRSHLPVCFWEAFELLQDQDTPIAVLVDEAQNWGADLTITGRDISSLLSEIHQNKQQLPLLLIAAGLGDAPEVIAQRGASKLKTEKGPLILGGLSDQEMAEVCDRFFDRYRIAGSEEQRLEWIQTLISETDGWPRHLTNALRGAAEALIGGQGDLSQSSLEDARANGQRFREKFYYDQTKPFQQSPELLVEVFSAMAGGDGTTSFALRKAITRAYENHPDLADEMPRRDVFTRLLHQGLIQDFGEDRYDCPIPSMRRYVEDFCAARGCPVAGAQSFAAPAPAAGMDMEA